MAIPSPKNIMKMTIRDLLADSNLEFHKEGSTLTFSTPDGVITIQPPKGGKAKAAKTGTGTSGCKRGPKGPRANSRVMELGPKIIELREQGKTQREIGQILGISTPYVSNIEKKYRDALAAGLVAPEATEAPAEQE